MLKPQTIVMVSGLFLIVVGVILIAAQFWIQIDQPEITFRSRSLGVGAGATNASVETTYVGLALVVLGVFLEAVGYVATKPWSKTE